MPWQLHVGRFRVNCRLMEETKTAEELQAALRAAGLRITEQRKALLAVLADADDHPDANELHRRAHKINPSVSLATVYRTLTTLEEQGVIDRHAFEGKPARFETNDKPHHDHLIDIDSGEVIEFRSDKIEALQAEIARELGYDIAHHRLEIYGKKRK